MNTYSFFSDETGLFEGQARQLSEAYVAMNTPAGHTAVQGFFDSAWQRMNLDTMEVEPYQPPAPLNTDMATYAWNDVKKRYDGAPTLLAIKAYAAQLIDASAGAARLRYITDIAGQQAVYLQKASEAEAYRAAGYTGPVPPYIAAEAGAMGMTGQQAADRILAIASAWGNELSPAIERVRINGKQAVEAAEDAAAVDAARTAAVAALGAI